MDETCGLNGYHVSSDVKENSKMQEKAMPCKLWGTVQGIGNFLMAEREGFEPPVPDGTIDFESITFNHSDTSPQVVSLK